MFTDLGLRGLGVFGVEGLGLGKEGKVSLCGAAFGLPEPKHPNTLLGFT